MLDFINREMSFIVHLKDLQLKSSYLSSEKIFNLSFSILDQFYFNQAFFICSILRIYISSNTKVFLENLANLADNKTFNIRNKIVLY